MNSGYGFLLVFLGAGLGGTLRHGANLLFARGPVPQLPLGTLVVNVVGSFALGVLAGLFASRGRAPDGQWLCLATGVLGGFTTFSAFSLDVVTLWNQGQASTGALYIVTSVALSVGAVLAGLRIALRTF